MRVPNICFNEDYKPVLIDFDISSKYSLPFHQSTDMIRFIKDVVFHVNKVEDFEEMDRLDEDEFLNTMKKGYMMKSC